ncbi:MAG: tRNA 4-thiouridine(8) synthase ThiI [Deltaproteobacteria bacterium]|nr:tRNA 4-thiouridine(8) synthase ThiI [Deltaproteobacteria bacterium]
MNEKRKTRAISLLSGGLDSLLAICVLREQGVSVTGLTFTTPFFGSKHAEAAAVQLDCEVMILDITDEHLEMLKRPPHGYGKCMNPCIDCHAMMIEKAGEIAKRDGYDVVATGEVLGERPMSQNRQSLDTVAKDSGCADILLRPLSAKLLEPTRPEIEGLVDRERLLDIQGRSRKPQMELAKKYGIKSYVQPAGGCLLTDPAFSARLKELLDHNPGAVADDVRMLRLGRHFRLKSGAKVVVGRNEKENDALTERVGENGILITSDITPGPVVYLMDSAAGSDVDMAARICASYADNGGNEIDMELSMNGERSRIRSTPVTRDEFVEFRI